MLEVIQYGAVALDFICNNFDVIEYLFPDVKRVCVRVCVCDRRHDSVPRSAITHLSATRA
jgi:hypothetical protein